MKLSKRLKAIADLISSGSNIIDIGADHALLDIYLANNKNCKTLATDISEKCIIKAKENIKKYNANVETKVTDGLNNLTLTDEIIIISGMGTHTIMKILDKKITNDLIISTHNDVPKLKKFLKKKGYKIFNEVVINDKHYYVITYYKYKAGNSIKNIYRTSNKEYNKYMSNIYKLKYQNEKNIFKKIKLNYIINQIKREC